MAIGQETTRRATPAYPMPGVSRDASVPSTEERNLPPELGQDAIAILEGRSFMYSDSVGDVPGGSIGGLVHADTRYLNRWELTINGHRFLALRSGPVDHYSAAFYLTNDQMPGMKPNTIAVRRERYVGHGMHERVKVESFAHEPLKIELRLAAGNDFADLFEMKSSVRDRSAEIKRDHAKDGSGLAFRYRHDGFSAETVVKVSPSADRVEGDDLVWQLTLQPHTEWTCSLEVPLKLGPNEHQPIHAGFGEVSTEDEDQITRWRAQRAKVDSDSQLLHDIIERTAEDLVALRIEAQTDETGEVILPAAGLPWFLTLFGRDTLITAFQTVAFGPTLARGALIALARFQGTEVNDFKDEEPGKILHEIRMGELTQIGVKPHNPYFGTADATILWLMLLSEYWRWTGDDELVKSLEQNTRAALRWIDEYGDRDKDGYVEYQTRSAQGLGNQCWRDSWDGVQFADATIPVLPIATCEIQGYVYDAKLRIAEIADGPLQDPELAQRLRSEAEQLRARFNEDFWIDDRGGYFAIGLDGDKRKIDSLTSNLGHLLWAGIVSQERAEVLAHQLMSEELFSGWGIRTLSTRDAGYNPIGYHLGTVWPHDSSIAAYGLARYGFREEANRIAMALFDAAAFSGNRLPEAFSGYPRTIGAFPIPYPTACSPQAWATGAPLLLVRAILGLEVRDREVTVDPFVPEQLGRIKITDLKAFGTRWDIEAIGRNGFVRLGR